MTTSRESPSRAAAQASPARVGRFDRLHPRSGPRVQYALAGTLWIVAGAILGYRAIGWLVGTPLAIPLWVAALVLGELKARYLMDRVARRAVERIRDRGSSSWVGGFLAPRSWLLIAVMMSAGHALRLTAIPRPWLGALYATVATGLLLSSRLYWRGARAQVTPVVPEDPSAPKA